MRPQRPPATPIRCGRAPPPRWAGTGAAMCSRRRSPAFAVLRAECGGRCRRSAPRLPADSRAAWVAPDTGRSNGRLTCGLKYGLPMVMLTSGAPGGMQGAHEFDGLGQRGRAGVPRGDAETVGIRHGVVRVHARGDDEAGRRGADLGDHVAQEAGAVLEGVRRTGCPRGCARPAAPRSGSGGRPSRPRRRSRRVGRTGRPRRSSPPGAPVRRR